MYVGLRFFKTNTLRIANADLYLSTYMKKTFLIALTLCFAVLVSAAEKVTLETLQADWNKYNNQVVTLTTPLVVCGNFYDSLILAPQRLYCPEEFAVGLADRDSTLYYQIIEQNKQNSICVHCRNAYYDVRTGDIIKNITARVTSERHLLTGKSLRTKHTKQAPLPKKNKNHLRVVGTNIENYFADLGGYATRKTTPAQQQVKTQKVVKALHKMDADIFAICEMQQGDKAPLMLLAELNKKGNQYDYVNLGLPNQDQISGAFIYNKERVRPYAEWLSAYSAVTSHYHTRLIAQGFELLDKNGQPTGKKLIVNVNHFKSKRAGRQAYSTHMRRLANTDSLLIMLPKAVERFEDSDILLLGDYNCYTQETPIQKIVRAGYADMLQAFCAQDYSYNYKGLVGYLDRCFASPSMAEQIVRVMPWHVNTDWYYSHGAYKMRDKSLHRYADHDPIIVDIKLK